MSKERPILFSGEMVRAILDGRKTQTRRIAKLRDPSGTYSTRDDDGWPVSMDEYGDWHRDSCPYGQPGDRLWVRETWVELLHTSPASGEPALCKGDKLIAHATRRKGGRGWNYDGSVIAYRATSDIEFCDGDGFTGDSANRDDMPRWRPSIHMPRWASRILLEITDVRVERLNEISEGDATAEGIQRWDQGPLMKRYGLPEWCPDSRLDSARGAFARLWTSIHSDGAWDANPFVWVISFKRLKP